MLGFTGVSRISSDLAGRIVENIRTGSTRAQLTEIHAIAREGLSALAHSADPREIGRLLHRSWEIKRTISDRMSNDDIDGIYAIARKSGAYGGKISGAGGGGFMLLFAPPERHERIRESLGDRVKVWIPFGIEPQGAHVLLFTND
jgi:D-glycero-alpha-D-manno-heptose-7-phosphate kinase